MQKHSAPLITRTAIDCLWKLHFGSVRFFVFQNNLAYVATSHLDGPTYQIICQSKIPITAVLSVIILGKALSMRQWISLTVLMFGVGLVQLSGAESAGKVSCWSFIYRECSVRAIVEGTRVASSGEPQMCT